MFSIFKKDINPLHSLRDYEDDFLSSKYDVLPFLPTTLFETKSSKYQTKIGSKTHASKPKSGTKFNTFTGEKGEAEHHDNHDTSFRKKHAEFIFHDKTFVYCKRSLYLFDETSRLRKFAVWLTHSTLFEIVTLIVIIFNCVLLGLRDYTETAEDNQANEILVYINPVFVAYYAVEAILRIIAKGFMNNSNSYLRSGWNYIDLFVAVSGLIYTEDALKYFSILRIGRVAKFLQPFKRFKGINHMMSIISTSFFPLISILGLLAFFTCVLAVFGLNLYAGKLDFRCRLTPEPVGGVWAIEPTLNKICGDAFRCPANLTCGSSISFLDQITYSGGDTYLLDFNWGLTNFNDFPQALFTIFIIINGNWRYLLDMLSDATGNITTLIYFFVIYVICRLFLIQLAVAVMLDDFLKIKEKENPKKAILSHAQISKIEGHDDKPLPNSEKKSMTFKERWEIFRVKYFPKVQVSNDEYYKNPFSRYTYILTTHSMFKYTTILLTTLNIVVIALNRYPLDQSQEDFIVQTNYVLTILFIIEVFLKVIGQSVPKYFQDNFNIIEFIIAILSMVEISSTSGVSAASVLRAFRLMRYMKRDYTWDNFKVLITVVFEGFTYVVDFTIILGLYMYVFAVLGMKYFAGKLRFSSTGYVDLENGYVPRANFDTLKEAYTVIFQVIVGEGVLEVILSTIRATGWVSVIFFIIIIITGNYLLIQLFLAIILGAFAEARDKVNYGQATSKFVVARLFQRKRTRKIESLTFIPPKDKLLGMMIEKHHAQIRSQAELESQENWAQTVKVQDELDEAIETNNHETHLTVRGMDSTRKPLVRKVVSRQELEDYTFHKQNSLFSKKSSSKIHPQLDSNPNIKPARLSKPTIKIHRNWRDRLHAMIVRAQESSLFIFHKDSKIRKVIGVVITHKIWETIILGSILLSSILLIVDNPLNDPDSTESQVYDVADQIFTYLFIAEMLLKVIYYGVFFNSEDNQKAYIRSYWNMIDCLVVTTSISDIATGGNSGLKSLKALRALRALRPLRVISRNEDLKLVVNALFRTFPSLKNLMIVAGLLLIMGATTGTAFFRGKFFRCMAQTSQDAVLDSPAITSKQDCIENGGVWINPLANYDNFLQAVLTYFKMITGEGWIQALYSGVDSKEIGNQPKQWARPIMIFYFYIVLLVGNVLIKNLFVGVVIDNFRQMKEELTGFLLLNDMQRDWAEMQIFMQRKKLKRILPAPRNHIRRACFKLVQDPRFEKFIIFLIVVNTIILGLTYSAESDEFGNVIQVLNIMFLGFFHLEAILKMIGLGVFYFKDAWNKFDLAIIILADATLLLTLLTDNYSFATIPTVIRALRLGQVVKYVKASKHIRVLVDTLYFLLPSLANIGALLILIMFIYAVLGMNLFAGIMPQKYISHWPNFQNILGALNILVRCALGQDWSYFMDELGDPDIPGCQDNQSYQDIQQNGILGCGTFIAYPYFITYVVTVTLILMNLFLAVVVGGYHESKKENEAVISPVQMDEFLDKWAEYDPQGTGFLTPEEFAFLIHDLPQPLGLKDNASVKYEYDLTAKKERGYLISENKKICLKRVQLFRDMRRYNIPVYSNRIHFSDACRSISFNAVIKAYKSGVRAQKPENELDFKMDDKIEEALREKLKIKSDYVNKTLVRGWVNRYGIIKKLQKEAKQANPKGLPAVHLTQAYAGKYIHIFWKKWKDEKKLYELQIAEKKGIDYDRTFEMQQRLANAQVNLHQKNTVTKTGKATRLYDKGKKRTQPSINSVPMLKEKDQRGTLNDAEGESYHPSILAEEAHETHLHDSNSSIESESEAESISVTSKANVEKLVEYKNNAGATIKRRGSGVSNFAQFKSFQGNEFWLQSVNPNPNEKFPIPVTIEIDNFMLNYLDQPESASSKTTESLDQDESTSQELGTPPTPPNRLLGKGMFGYKGGEEEEKNGESDSKSSIDRRSQSSESQSLGENPDTATNLKIIDRSPLDEENTALRLDSDRDMQDKLDMISDTQSPEQLENKTKFLEAGKANLEIIEENHEEENQVATRPEIENKIRPFNADVKPGRTLKIKDSSLKLLDNTEEGFTRESGEKGSGDKVSQEGTKLTIEGLVSSPKGNQVKSAELEFEEQPEIEEAEQ